MKILITLFTVLSLSANAQIKVKVIDATGVERWIDYVQGVTTVSGVTKTQLDSLNTSLRGYITGTFTNLQTWASNTFALKGGTGSIPNVISLPEQIFASIVTPTTYNTTYSDGTRMDRFYNHGYSTFPGVNSRSNRPDLIYLIAGYNVNANNGKATTTDAAWDISVETHYDIPTIPDAAFEFHLARSKDYSGKEHRHLSGYFSKKNGGGFWNMEGNSLNLFNPGFENQNPYFKAFDGRIELRNETPNNSGTGLFLINDASMGGQTIELHQRGGVGVFKIPANPNFSAKYSLEFNGFNGLGLVQGFYSTNAEARAANLRPGIDTYWTRINGIKVLAQVE